MEAESYSVTSVDFYLFTRCYVSEDNTLHSHRCENLNFNFECLKKLNVPTSGSCILLEVIAQILKTFLALYGTQRVTTRSCYWLYSVLYEFNPHTHDLEIYIAEFKVGNSSLCAPVAVPLFFRPLGATAQGELWPPEQSASISPRSSLVQTIKRRMVE
jgi:hypothetical protein